MYRTGWGVEALLESTPQNFKALVRVSATRDQAAVPAFQVGQTPQSIMLRFEQPIRIVKGLQGAGQLSCLNLGKDAFSLAKRCLPVTTKDLRDKTYSLHRHQKS